MINIIIPVVDLLSDTKVCIDSIKNTKEKYQLIIVNNGSDKETSDYLNKLKCILINNKENLGFVKATNQGILASSGDVILLNNDVILPEGWIEKLMAVAQIDETIGLIGPLSESRGGNASQQDMNRVQDRCNYKLPTVNNNFLPVDAIAFFCTFIKRTVIDKVGLLDENFGFGQSDDVDYCIRAQKMGYKIAIATDLLIQHKVSATYTLLSINRLELYYKNRGYLLNKHRDYFK